VEVVCHFQRIGTQIEGVLGCQMNDPFEYPIHPRVFVTIHSTIPRPCETWTSARQRRSDFSEGKGDRLDHQHSDRRLPRVDLGSPLPAKQSCRACLGRLPRIVFERPITTRSNTQELVSQYGGILTRPKKRLTLRDNSTGKDLSNINFAARPQRPSYLLKSRSCSWARPKRV
jgi:hypothetical protein